MGGKRRKHRHSVKAVFSAFIVGLLTVVGINPSQMIFNEAIVGLGPYLQFASLLVLAVTIYFAIGSIIDWTKRAKKAYRVAGIIGVIAILTAFVSGFIVLIYPDKSVILLVSAAALWLVATWKWN